MMEMLNRVLQRDGRKVKQHLSSPFMAHRLVLKKGSLKRIMEIKGWNDYQDVADALRFTRQYIQMIDKTRVQVGPEFITRLALSLGNIGHGWWLHFEIIPHGVIDDNHPKWNQAKHDGEVPYAEYSTTAVFRNRDYSVEKKLKPWQKENI